MASTIFRLDSRSLSAHYVKNRLQSCSMTVTVSRLRSRIQRQVISTSTVFSTPDTGKIPKGREMGCPFRLADGNRPFTTLPLAGNITDGQPKLAVYQQLHIHFAERVETQYPDCVYLPKPSAFGSLCSEPKLENLLAKRHFARHVLVAVFGASPAACVGLFFQWLR